MARPARDIYERFVEKIQFCEHNITCEDCCWLYNNPTQIINSGYVMFYVRNERDQQRKSGWKSIVELAHRFMLAWAQQRPIQEGLQSLHTCDVKLCVQPAHLYEGTPQDNVDDMWERHRAVPPPLNRMFGEKNPQSFLIEDDIHLIYELCGNGSYTQKEIADIIGCSYSCISDIMNGNRWAHAWETFYA